MNGAGLMSLGVVPSVLLFGFLGVASVWDLRRRRVPNFIVLGLAAAGLGVNLGIGPLGAALLTALGGLLVGAALWLPPYLFRHAGGGDLKLAAAVGVWLGPVGVLRASVYAALVGGVMALMWLWWYRGTLGGWVFLKTLPISVRTSLGSDAPPRMTIPFAVAIAVGVALEVSRFSLFR